MFESRRRWKGAVLASLAAGLVASACGGHHAEESTSAAAGRVIEVSMTDMAYTPSSLTVAKGETVTFRFRNDGAVVHEAVLGDDAYQSAHAASMASADDHDHDHGGHGARTSVTVQPGKTAALTYTFAEGGTLLLGCHRPGHYEAGMKATIAVA